MKLSTRARQAAAVWAVLKDLSKKSGGWATSVYIANRANKYPGVLDIDTASVTARIRDFRKPRFGGHTIVCKRVAGYSAPVYRLIR